MNPDYMCVCVCVCACVRAACVRACVRVCVIYQIQGSVLTKCFISSKFFPEKFGWFSIEDNLYSLATKPQFHLIKQNLCLTGDGKIKSETDRSRISAW